MERVQPRPEHVAELATHMRVSDRAALKAAGYTDLEQIVRVSLTLSTRSSALINCGRVVAIFGLVPLPPHKGLGAPWMMGTDLVTRHRRALIRLAPALIAEMLQVCPSLINLVHADNEFSIRWLTKVGFTMHAPEAHPVTGAPFRRFEMRS